MDDDPKTFDDFDSPYLVTVDDYKVPVTLAFSHSPQPMQYACEIDPYPTEGIFGSRQLWRQ
jgi:hypothetical protein